MKPATWRVLPCITAFTNKSGQHEKEQNNSNENANFCDSNDFDFYAGFTTGKKPVD
jgi:hypothetical protein